MKKPKIVIDARMLGPGMHGIARYVDLLLTGLAQIQRDSSLDYEIGVLVSKEFPIDQIWSQDFQLIECESRFLSPREWFEIPRILKQFKADLYHSPSFSSLPYCPVPWIVTVHDLCHLRYGSWFQKAYYGLLLRRFCAQAAHVVTVSEFSQKEILQWTQVKGISIVQNAIDPKMVDWKDREVPLAHQTLAHHGLEFRPSQGGYFVCLSNSKAHKNVETLVQAFQEWHQSIELKQAVRTQLVLIGRGLERFQAVEGVRVLSKLSQTEILHVLMGSQGFMHPSAYEGFGLPPVEAAAIGRPVVVSDIQPHHEGLADLTVSNVVWVKPHDLGGWRAGMDAIAKQHVIPADLSLRKKILERFAVSRLASSMDTLYKNMLTKKYE